MGSGNTFKNKSYFGNNVKSLRRYSTFLTLFPFPKLDYLEQKFISFCHVFRPMAEYETIEGRRRGTKASHPKLLVIKNNVYKTTTNLRCYNHSSENRLFWVRKFFVKKLHLHLEQFLVIEKLKVKQNLKINMRKHPWIITMRIWKTTQKQPLQ